MFSLVLHFLFCVRSRRDVHELQCLFVFFFRCAIAARWNAMEKFIFRLVIGKLPRFAISATTYTPPTKKTASFLDKYKINFSIKFVLRPLHRPPIIILQLIWYNNLQIFVKETGIFKQYITLQSATLKTSFRKLRFPVLGRGNWHQDTIKLLEFEKLFLQDLQEIISSILLFSLSYVLSVKINLFGFAYFLWLNGLRFCCSFYHSSLCIFVLTWRFAPGALWNHIFVIIIFFSCFGCTSIECGNCPLNTTPVLIAEKKIVQTFPSLKFYFATFPCAAN